MREDLLGNWKQQIHLIIQNKNRETLTMQFYKSRRSSEEKRKSLKLKDKVIEETVEKHLAYDIHLQLLI